MAQPPRITTTRNTSPVSQSIEAKLVVLGSQGVGKTSLVTRFISPHVPLTSHPSTVGASFVTKRILDPDTSTTVRLQIWDTAGQERFRSISRLYYRGANAGLLCYDITDEQSWEDMKGWFRELRENAGEVDGECPIIHVVGTKSDIVADDPTKRQVPFERTIAYVAEQLCGSTASTPPVTMKYSNANPNGNNHVVLQSPDSKRSSGFWGQDIGWDSCHEVNAKDGEGIEEVFRVIARKLVEQRHRREDLELSQTPRGLRTEHGVTGEDYFGNNGYSAVGSFRVGLGDKRRSWLGLPSVGLGIGDDSGAGGSGRGDDSGHPDRRSSGRCC